MILDFDLARLTFTQGHFIEALVLAAAEEDVFTLWPRAFISFLIYSLLMAYVTTSWLEGVQRRSRGEVATQSSQVRRV